eukprot:TRINITY_DN11681_c0_g1_i1.p1 TRINITY_DN11681_c0_g1~~TRINITY_DN11681_c0_g1_i1.p1  ORF type:complete len:126 (-),score=22.61 TRINITY_DN11681_c0_g1_i1:597-974(-)
MAPKQGAAKVIAAELLRNADGTVIYMEAGGDLVDELLHVLRAPVGAVMRCASDARGKGEVQRSCMEKLCASVASLRGPLFNCGSADVVPGAYNIDEVKVTGQLCQQCGGQHERNATGRCASYYRQ